MTTYRRRKADRTASDAQRLGESRRRGEALGLDPTPCAACGHSKGRHWVSGRCDFAGTLCGCQRYEAPPDA